MPQRRLEIPMITREATVREINPDSRVVKVAWTTGAAVRRFSWASGRKFDEVLVVEKKAVRMERLNNGAPLLNSHGSYDLAGIIGVVERAWIENGEGLAEVRFAKGEDNEEADRYFRMVKDEIIRNVSCGYVVHKFEIEKNEETGNETWRAVDWEPVEISFVGVPADAGAGTRAAPETFACEVVERNQEESEEMTRPNPNPAPGSDPAATPPVPPVVVDEAAVRSAAIAAERKRVGVIRSKVRAAIPLGLPEAESEALADKLINEGVAEEHVPGRIFDDLAARGQSAPAPKITIGADNTDPAVIGERIQNALTARMTSGLPKEIKTPLGDIVAIRVEMRDDARPYAGLRIVDMWAEHARAQGHKIDTRQPPAVIYDQCRSLTTSDFPVLLGGAVRRSLLAAYDLAQPNYTRIFRKRNFTDFRPHNFLRVGSFPPLLVTNEAGEYKYGSLVEAGNAISALNYGRMVKVSKQLIVNDDIGALSELPRAAGQAAAILANKVAFATFSANSGGGPTITEPNAAGVQTGVALWHATHGNLASPGTTIANGLDAAVAALETMKDLDGNPILNNRPAILLVHPNRRAEALRAIAAITPATTGTVNIYTNAFEVISDPTLPDNSWYLFVSPDVREGFVYGYLEGQEGPQTDTKVVFETDGVVYKVTLVFGAGAIDFRSSYKNPGA